MMQDVGHFHQRLTKGYQQKHTDMAIIDEFQDFRSSWIQNVKSTSNSQIWLGDPTQQIYQDAKDDHGVSTLYSEFENSHTKYPTAEFDSNVNKVVVAYEDEGDSGKGKAAVGTVSGDSITFGTPVTFESSGMYFVGTTFDTTNNKIIICYTFDGAEGRAVVGTVNSGSNTISFGSPVTFLSATASYPKVTYDSSNQKIVVVYRHNDDSGKCKAVVGTVSG